MMYILNGNNKQVIIKTIIFFILSSLCMYLLYKFDKNKIDFYILGFLMSDLLFIIFNKLNLIEDDDDV